MNCILLLDSFISSFLVVCGFGFVLRGLILLWVWQIGCELRNGYVLMDVLVRLMFVVVGC